MSRTMLNAIVVVSMFASLQSSAAVYKCTDKSGQTIYSGQPCATNAEEIKVKTHTPSADEVANAQNEISELSNYLTSAKRQRDISDLESDILGKQRTMENEISILRAKQNTANNNLAGAQYYAGLATEMQAVTTRYQAEIDSLRRKIEIIKSAQ
jgi:hypothetical protein